MIQETIRRDALMKPGRLIFAILGIVSLCLALQRGMFPGGGQYGRQDFYSYQPLVPSEFYWSRLQYNSSYAGGGSSGTVSAARAAWSRDYPKADNDCLIALRRLTHINSPSPLNVVDLDSDHIYDYPWIYAVHGEHLDLHRRRKPSVCTITC